MNKQVSHIGIAALVLLSALIVGTTYWQTWANAGLANRQDNDIRLVAQFTIKRGKIYASDGRTLLATNVSKDRAGQTLYFRRYPTGPIFSDVVGYSTQTRNRTGLEQSYNDYLTGSNANLDTVFRSALDKLRGITVTGNDLVLTIRPSAQALALRLLRGKCGAVVALDPSSGRVLVMATNPIYNPNLIESRFIVTRVVVRTGRSGERELVFLKQVAAADLNRIEANFGGVDIEGPLNGRRGLGAPGPAERARRGGGGQQRHGVDLDLGNVVGARSHELGHERQHGADVGISTAVLQHLESVRADVSIFGAAHFYGLHLAAPVHQTQKVLGAGFDPLRRTPELASHPNRQEFLGRVALLGSETTADVGRDDPHHTLLEAE